MAKADPQRALAELARRAGAQQAASSVVEGIRSELFDKQLDFIDDTARNKAAICTRRAGKTSMWPRYGTIVALKRPKSLIRIWGISRLRAKQLLWSEFKDVFARHSLKVQCHETELTMRFENGSEIRLLGADKDKEAQKKRGDRTTLEIILETQLFGPFLRTLVEDVAEPCLFDERGTMCLEGTPGPVPTGYWFWVTGDSEGKRWDSTGMLVSMGGHQNEKERVGAGWSCHRWSLLDNPHLPHAAVEVERIRKRKNWTIDTPSYKREYLGLWVRDDGVLFYKYNAGRNNYSLSDVQPWGPGWKHVLGWDLGHIDDMALNVWGWHPTKQGLYQAAEWKKSGAMEEEVMAQIDRWEKMGFNFIAKVADTQGGGKMTVEHTMIKSGHVFEPAKKSEKLEHVRLMNEEFVSATLFVMEGSQYSEELAGLPKDPDWDPDSGVPPGEASSFPNHLCFVAGTRVLTADGEVPIEDVHVGTLVLTRAGLRPVVQNGFTGVREVITRVGLTGTPEHPVLTTRGWQRLDSLLATDVVLYAWNTLDELSGAVSSGTDSLSPAAVQTVCTTSHAQEGDRGGSTGRSMSQPTDPYLTAGTYITSTATRSTMKLPTWGQFLAPSTLLSTPASGGERTRRPSSTLLKRVERLLQHGIVRLLGGLGILRWLPRSRLRVYAQTLSVASVEAGSKALEDLCSAQRLAERDGTPGLDERQGSTTLNECAGTAASPSSSTSTESRRTAAVYALSVEGQHEYFANGVLVSNCDAGLYSWRKAMHFLDFEAPKEEEPMAVREEREHIDALIKLEERRANREEPEYDYDADEW